MFSFYNYVYAKRRLKESKKTIIAMGGEDKCPPIMSAQHDMISYEAKYYKQMLRTEIKIEIVCVVLFVILYYNYI